MTTTLTIQQIIDEWLSTSDIAEVSKRSYRTKLGLWFRYLASIHYNPRVPARQQVLDWKRELESAGRSTLTVDSYITAVRLFYRYCSRRGYYTDITQGVRSATKYKGYRKLSLTREEAITLLDSIDTTRTTGKRDKLAIAMMLMLGLRTCELERMNVGDIESAYGKRVVMVQRKGRHDKSEAAALTPYLDELLCDYMGEREVDSWDDPLFLAERRERGQRLKRTTISEMVHDRLRAIGINDPRITAHSLRHTCAQLLLSEGVDMATVQNILGHTSINTTRLYTDQMQRQLLIRNTPSVKIERALRLSSHRDSNPR